MPLRLPRQMHLELKLLATFTGQSANAIVTRLIAEHLAGPGREVIERGMTETARATYGEALDTLADQ